MEYKTILTGLFERLSGFSKERPQAGQKYRLMGITAELLEVIRQLRTEVLVRVSQEAPIDVDIDIDYGETAGQALQAKLPEDMAGWQSDKTLSEIAQEAREYADLRIDEAKLKATRGLSTALGQTLAYLLIFAVLTIVLGLLSLALLQWLNRLVGSPWGTLIVAGVFVIALIALWMRRGKLFRDLFVKLFIDVFYDSEEE